MEALTIKTFKTSKISDAKVSENLSKDFKYKSLTFAYDGGEVPPIRVDGKKCGCSVFAKIYLKKSGKTRCRISKGSYKILIEIDELVDENFRGSCILRIYQACIGSSKSISLSVEEILVREVDRKESYSLMRMFFGDNIYNF